MKKKTVKRKVVKRANPPVKKKTEVLIKKGRNWKLTRVSVSGNYVVTFMGKEYIHANKESALRQIESIKKVGKILKRDKK